jgi:cell division protein FtsB
MAHAAPLYVEHSIKTRERRSEQAATRRLAEQVRSLQEQLSMARKELEFLTAERDELVLAIKEWANDRT